MQFGAPESNPFIPTSFAMFPDDATLFPEVETCIFIYIVCIRVCFLLFKYVCNRQTSSPPVMISDTDYARVWYRQVR
jgi:hypothetical protein